ncbi:hypothetical protein INT45_005576 [Circinella minor]|uniref:Uncharacterized protein n=1 Tax=Circinella minor TaxID=1195481 RepID=A0A8H7S9M8_9FUNG|nr:hypothetical protein INT45_005576 [Circinella minor]
MGNQPSHFDYATSTYGTNGAPLALSRHHGQWVPHHHNGNINHQQQQQQQIANNNWYNNQLYLNQQQQQLQQLQQQQQHLHQQQQQLQYQQQQQRHYQGLYSLSSPTLSMNHSPYFNMGSQYLYNSHPSSVK